MAAPGENRRPLLLWAGLLVLVAVAFAVVVVVLNATVYSPAGFVRGYLHALDRGDSASALELAGVTPHDGDDLLGLSQEGRIRDVSTSSTLRDGVATVTARFSLDGTASSARFTVVRGTTIAGLFSGWAFQKPPTSFLDVTPRHDRRFLVGGVLVTAQEADIATRYTVLTPGVFELSHDTTYLVAAKKTVVAAAPGGVTTATVAVAPKDSFTAEVRRDVTKYLRTTCAPQRVLFPSGCPFGEEVDDRVTSEPSWSISRYPAVALQATATPGVWRVREAAGTARLKVEAQSLFDGHAYTIDEPVPFDVEYLVTIGSDNNLTITPR